MKVSLTYDQLKGVYTEKGYAFFDKGNYNLNIGGIRLETSSNKFDDVIFVAYKIGDKKVVKYFEATTDPGSHWLKHPMNDDGCFIMKPGQYRGAYTPGPHGKHKYRALRQFNPMSGYRDDNKDSIHDMNESSVQTGMFYTNLHHGWNASVVERNSAGCQVVRYKKDLKAILYLVDKAIPLYGPLFTYTLLEKQDIDGIS